MKKIVLVALLAAAACSKKGSDCDTAIAKAMDNFTANMKEHATNPQVLERRMGLVDKLKTTLTERCKADGWSSEATACYAAAANRNDMEGCKAKMTPEQVSKLTADLTQVMMGAMGGMRPGGMGAMPPGMAGHPGTLAPSAPPAGGSDPAAAPAPGAAPAPPAPGAAPPAAPAAPPAGSGTN